MTGSGTLLEPASTDLIPPFVFYDSNAILIEKLEKIAGVTNEEVLSDQEILRGRTLLSQAQDMFADFGSWRTTSTLGVQYDLSLPEHISRLSIALAPHKRLPIELLEYTFRSYFASEYSLQLPPVRSQGPWVLGQVCRRWRQLSRSIRDLWYAAISFDINDDGFNTYHAVDMSLNQLKCAVELFPEIGYICVAAYRDYDVFIAARPLIPYLHRVSELSWNVQSEPVRKSIEIFPPEAFSSLETLKISLLQPTDEKHHNNNDSYVDLFGERCRLQHLMLGSDTPSFLFNYIPWSQLYSFSLNIGWSDMNDYTRSDWIQLGLRNPFSEMSSLKELSFEMKDEFFSLVLSFGLLWHQVTSLKMIWYDSPHDHTIITLWKILRKCISLSKFRLDFRKNSSASFVINQDTITFPSLISIELGYVASPMIKLFHSGALNLLDFETSISLQDFYAIMKASPLLEYLSCTLSGKQLTSGDTITLPHLTTLKISLDEANSFPALLLAPSLTNLLVLNSEYGTAPDIATLSNFIWNSKMRLKRFHFGVDNTDTTAYDLRGDAPMVIYGPLRNLLAALPQCFEVDFSFVILPAEILDDIAERRLLPCVEDLAISTSNRLVLLSTVRRRLELELQQRMKSDRVATGHSLIRIMGYLPHDEYHDEGLDVAFEDLEDQFGVSWKFQSIDVLVAVNYFKVEA
ncbi:hypothetical protein C0995_009819 [Termitomyces sp. Mi166|nr:hypothetical protein C0995_009819 [Termitomyces sp. Mi166\